MKEKINPTKLIQAAIIVSKGLCLNCLTQMFMIETDINHYSMDKDAIPKDYANVYHKIIYVCPKCGRIDRVSATVLEDTTDEYEKIEDLFGKEEKT